MGVPRRSPLRDRTCPPSQTSHSTSCSALRRDPRSRDGRGPTRPRTGPRRCARPPHGDDRPHPRRRPTRRHSCERPPGVRRCPPPHRARALDRHGGVAAWITRSGRPGGGTRGWHAPAAQPLSRDQDPSGMGRQRRRADNRRRHEPVAGRRPWPENRGRPDASRHDGVPAQPRGSEHGPARVANPTGGHIATYDELEITALVAQDPQRANSDVASDIATARRHRELVPFSPRRAQTSRRSRTASRTSRRISSEHGVGPSARAIITAPTKALSVTVARRRVASSSPPSSSWRWAR